VARTSFPKAARTRPPALAKCSGGWYMKVAGSHCGGRVVVVEGTVVVVGDAVVVGAVGAGATGWTVALVVGVGRTGADDRGAGAEVGTVGSEAPVSRPMC
jgi:hypothetical protein